MMAYVNQFVVSVIVDGKPQREFSDNGRRSITIPFGTEYKIRLKNQSYKKALVNVSIDGASIFSAGQQLILRGHQSIDLERFVDNLNEGKKLKFVSKEQAAAEGHFDPTPSEMGLLKVEFVPEMEFPALIGSTKTTLDGGILRSFGSSHQSIFTNSVAALPANSFQAALPDSSLQSNATLGYAGAGLPVQNTVGGTVEGGDSSQQFGISNDLVLWAWGQKATVDIKMKGPAEVEKNYAFGYQNLATSIRKDSQEYTIHSIMTTTSDGSITVVYGLTK